MLSTLAACQLIAFAFTERPAESKEFYKNVLGLKLVDDTAAALMFDANGTMLRITKLQSFRADHFTVLGWKVPHIAAVVEELTRKGVEFERYEGFGQDDFGIWTSPEGGRIAWFKDPDGNILSLTQFKS
jgi:catechol 2,3-dioxygenase-like lactoylglutathione lyase family enzyme